MQNGIMIIISGMISHEFIRAKRRRRGRTGPRIYHAYRVILSSDVTLRERAVYVARFMRGQTEIKDCAMYISARFAGGAPRALVPGETATTTMSTTGARWHLQRSRETAHVGG